MNETLSQYWKSCLSRRNFGKVSIAAAGALALPLSGRSAALSSAPGEKIVKNVSFLYRKPEFSHEKFIKYWVEVHAPMANHIPHIRRYVVCPVTTYPEKADDPGPDGVAEVWFDNLEISRNFGSSPEAKKWAENSRTFIARNMTVTVEEIVVIAGLDASLR